MSLLREKKRLYLPDINSACVTKEYLMSAAKGEIFALNYEELKFMGRKPLQKQTRSGLVEILALLTKKKLGFSTAVFKDSLCRKLEPIYSNFMWLNVITATRFSL